MKIGSMRVDALIDGEALLPKEALYGGEQPPTEEDWRPYSQYLDTCTGHQLNTLGSFLIRYGDKVILNDAGAGPTMKAPFTGGGLRSALWALGVSPLDVTDVIYSHLHLDHVGWTSLEGKPFFPNADLWVDRRDWEYYADPDYVLLDWEAAVIDPETETVAAKFAPVLEHVHLFETDTELMPGIRALDAAGHSPGNTVYELSSDGERGLLIGDVVHTQGELLHAWDLNFGHDRPQAIETIERFRKYLYDSELPFAAAHFPGMKWGRLVKGDNAIGIDYQEFD